MPARMTPRRPRFAPRLVALEPRDNPAQFGLPWADPRHLTLSFVPDGTTAAGVPAGGPASDLFARLDAAMPRATWQGAVTRAAQTWAELADLTIGVVADGGQPLAAPGPAQADGRFGDIRVGGFALDGDLGEGVPPDPFAAGTLGGDVVLNTAAAYTPDTLYAVALHEIGHALGLAHRDEAGSVLNPRLDTAATTAATPTAGDVAAVRVLYGARAADPNEGRTGNATLRNATRVRYPHPSAAGEDGSVPLVGWGDITARTDVDIFWVKPLAGYTGAMTVRVQTAGVSLLAPKVTLYDPDGRQIARVTATGAAGDVVTVTVPSVRPDEKYYVRVEAAPGAAARVGRFGVGITFDRLVRADARANLEAVLRGPFDGLDEDDLYVALTDPAAALYADDDGEDDTAATAADLAALPAPAGAARYAAVASLADAADADFYRVRAPDVRAPVVLTATVAGFGPNALTPRVELFDRNGVRLTARVLVNGNGTYTVQVAGLEGNRREYYARVFGAGSDPGNYALDVRFGPTAASPRTAFASGSLAAPGSEAGYAVYVGRAQLFGFALSAAGGTGSVRAEVRRVGDPAPVFTLTAAAGETVTGVAPLLPPGEYRVTFTRVGGTAGDPLTFTLEGDGLTDPVGPVAGSATLGSQYQAPGRPPGEFLYPIGTVTTDPFRWLFVYAN
ncbi:MAG: matrixin family metalloprotease [Gemmataceae bacterium]|nr:matrixin family metalloprotease [Gemmataceae bacterium]